MRRVLLAPSILNADFRNLESAISFIQGYADVVHLDIMDGNFVPNLTFGPMVVKAVRSITDLPLDVHLMIAQPMEYIEDFRKAGADWISFHVEVARHVGEVAGAIRRLGAKAGVALSPQTPAHRIKGYADLLDFVLVMTVMPGFGGQQLIPESLKKVAEVKELAASEGRDLPVQVDGGVKFENLDLVVRSGVDIVVVGSSIYADADPAAAAARTRRRLDELAAADARAE
jgi:ribulose-phosphate 3-epimerase